MTKLTADQPKEKKQKNKGGRPSTFSPDMCEKICSKIAEGMSLRKICSENGMPTVGTVCLWLAKDREFSEQYARAREAQAETMADEILDIADKIPPMNPTTGAYDSGAVNHQRLRIDSRKWVASKLKPKKYGDRLDLSSADGTMTPKTVALDASKLSTATLNELLAVRERTTETD